VNFIFFFVKKNPGLHKNVGSFLSMYDPAGGFPLTVFML